MQPRHSYFVPLIVAAALAILFGILSIIGLAGTMKYKNNVDQQIAAANQKAVDAANAKKDAEFAEKEKSPLATYNAPSQFDSMSIQYPKTWSAYINDKGDLSSFEAYFNKGYVPFVSSQSSYGLRVQLTNRSYASELGSFDANVKNGNLKASAYKLPSVPNGETGVKLEGQIDSTRKGIIVLLPVRNHTLKIFTENSTEYGADFVDSILAKFTYAP